MMKTLICGFSLAALAGSSAYGQTLPDMFKVSEKEKDTFIDLGAAVITRPAYLGSDKQDTNILPYVNGEYKGRFFANPFLGAGVYALNTKKIKISGAAFFTPNRNPEDTPFTGEPFDLDTGVSARLSAQYFFKYFYVGALGDIPVSGDMDGAQVTFRVGTFYPVTNKLSIAPTLQAAYSTEGWNNSLYGINPQQAAAAKIPTFNYSKGFSSAGVSMAAFYDLGDNITIVGLASYDALLGDIKDSPLTPDNSGLTATLGIAKRF